MATEPAPHPPHPSTRARLRAQPRRDTKPERELRRELTRLRLRYRLHRRLIPNTRREIDIAFPSAKVAVDVRGCWWHGCPDHSTTAVNNGGWWGRKIEANRRRDADTATRLDQEGWRLIVIWEHEDAREAAARIGSLVRERLL